MDSLYTQLKKRIRGSIPEAGKPRPLGPLSMAVAFCLTIGMISGCASLNNYRTEGRLELSGLSRPVRVVRDEKGMAYIHAENMADAYLAQGFVTAQDRLFQMELTRLFSEGRISELAGEKARNLDIRMRTVGFFRHAKRHAEMLDAPTRLTFQRYVDGVNAYVRSRQETHPLEFKLAGIRPGPWTVADALAIYYYMGWNSSANMRTEIIAQLLADELGPEKAQSLLPLNINPDDPADASLSGRPSTPEAADPVGLDADSVILSYLTEGGLHIGSNNWAVGAGLSGGGKPIVANDPHLDARMLPGPWYPFGLIAPEVRAVGVTIPGLPGMPVFRNAYVAAGVTNAYGDAQDLYVETLDPDNPDRYMEGGRSIPFRTVKETLAIKDKAAPDGVRRETIRIRLTGRGPVVSGILPKGLARRVITLRWSPFEAMTPRLGLDRLLHARSAPELRRMLGDVGVIGLNYVFADRDGNIGWHVTGKLPIRTRGDGTFPVAVTDGSDNWAGWIPFDRMPHDANPEKGWLGTCNHRTVGRDYPYYYSSRQAASYRYRRLKQLLERPGKTTAGDHWRYQRDTLNLMAKSIAPIMSRALAAHGETREMGRILSQWDFRDDPDLAAPAIFQSVYRHFAFLVYRDELGEGLARAMLGDWYFWQERLHRMVVDGTSPWFDDIGTGDVTETRDLLFYRAALAAAGELGARFGRDPHGWLWKKVHRITYVSPIRREGFGKGFLGGGTHPVGGSGETLRRNIYAFDKPYDVTISASLRMVADLADDDKVLAVMPGGVSGRIFHPHATDQIEPFMTGEKQCWWFSDRAIQAHTRSTLVLVP